MLRQLDKMIAERDMYRAHIEQGEGYIDHLLKPLQHAAKSHVPPLALAQRTTNKFEGVRDIAKAVREWIRDIKEKGEKIIEDVKEMAHHRETIHVKMFEVKRDCFKVREVAGVILPLIGALFWTHTQIPTLSTILDPYDINTFKEWYWTANMKNDTKDTINKEECEEIL